MLSRIAIGMLVFAATVNAQPSVVIELVPDNPGPYVGGESITVDVWAHSQLAFDTYVDFVRLDFADSSNAIDLDPIFTFDLSAAGAPEDFQQDVNLPIPWVWNSTKLAGDFWFLYFPAGDSFRIGTIDLRLPTRARSYRLDVSNADDPNQDRGLLMATSSGLVWRASLGEIDGGVLDFDVSPPIPTVSHWGMAIIALLLLSTGTVIATRRCNFTGGLLLGSYRVIMRPVCSSRQDGIRWRVTNFTECRWRTVMYGRMIAGVLVLTAGAAAQPSVVIELVPDNPGPYIGGESITVDVWAHSQVAFDAHVWYLQLDFSDSADALDLDPTFSFDRSSSIAPNDFQEDSALLIPWTSNLLEYICPECRLQLPANGSLHIGSIGLRLPAESGIYRLDVANADDPDSGRGAQISDGTSGFFWQAATEDISGGAINLTVTVPQIPTVSQWGLSIIALLLLSTGTVIATRRCNFTGGLLLGSYRVNMRPVCGSAAK